MRGVACVGVLSALLVGRPLAAQDKLVSEGDEWRYFEGSEAPPVDWAEPGFDDTSWAAGATPIGYSSDLPYATRLEGMQGNFLAVYYRRAFVLPDPTAVRAITLAMKYDDGFVAYLNGRELLRKSMPDGAPTKDTAALDHETNTVFENTILACEALDSAVAGRNVLAVEVHNATLSSSDSSFSLELTALTGSPCLLDLTCTLRPNNLVFLRWSRPAGLLYEALVLERNGVPLQPGPSPMATSFTDRTAVPGTNTYRAIATFCGVACSGDGVPECSVTLGGGEPEFRRGDVDQNGSIGINDPVLLLNSLFRDAGPLQCPDSADADDNGQTQLTDAVFLLRYLFQAGGSPPPPLDACGADPTADALGACAFTGCP